MKSFIISIFIVCLYSTVALGQQNTLKDNEYADYDTCKQIITNDRVSRSIKCQEDYGPLDTCKFTSAQLLAEIRAYCGIDPAPRKPVKKNNNP